VLGEEGFSPPAIVVVEAPRIVVVVVVVVEVVVVVGGAIDSIQTEEPARSLDPGRGL